MSEKSPVILIMIDGLRPDAIDAANCPNLQAFRQRSAHTMRAQSVMPSITLPCHTSIFHSVPPERHGILENVWHPMARPLPGLVDLADNAGLHCAFIINWEPLRDLSRPGARRFTYFSDIYHTEDPDAVMVDECIRYFERTMSNGAAPDFTFLYLGTVDEAGHEFGWMEAGYLKQVEHVDAHFGRVIDALPDSATILTQADHGGHDRSHGTEMPEDMTIPWMIAGPSVRAGHEIASDVSLLDSAPTLAHFLGIKPHMHWEGRCVEEILITKESK